MSPFSIKFKYNFGTLKNFSSRYIDNMYLNLYCTASSPTDPTKYLYTNMLPFSFIICNLLSCSIFRHKGIVNGYVNFTITDVVIHMHIASLTSLFRRYRYMSGEVNGGGLNRKPTFSQNWMEWGIYRLCIQNGKRK